MTTKIIAALGAAALAASAASLNDGFLNPPEQTKPWCYWYWINDNTSKEGITRDLEAMARVGIGEAFIGNIFLDDISLVGKTKVLTEAWWGLVEHAIREGGRVGVNVGMFNCPGWSQSGGPWVKPQQAMRYLVSSETRVTGPTRFESKLPMPREPFQDVAVLAFPAPENDADTLAAHSPKLTCTPAVEGADRLVDGRLDTMLAFPRGAGQGSTPFSIEMELPVPLTARSLALVPGDSGWAARCELQAAGAEGQFRPVKTFKFDRSNMAVNVGPMPRGPVVVSFSPVTASRFRLLLTGVNGPAALAEMNLSSAARLESVVEKQLGKMHPTPLPMWDTYLWPAQPGPDSPKLAVAPASVLNLTAKLGADGTLRWDAPVGEWVILRTGMTPTGTRNSPSSPEGQGLEIDKMNREAARMHFEAFIGQVLKRIPAADRRAFKRVVADSYEMGSQNWTDGFAGTFQKRYGYDPAPWLPVLTGRIVGSADQSDRFLWDLRRLVADHIASDYVGGLRDQCHPHGLQLWLENYGHWGYPAEFLQYGSWSDRIGGEFWVTGDLGSIELRAASSCANTYGRPIVSAESFTGGPPFQTVPAGLKARGDWSFCEGINHVVLHVNISQPWEDRKPGINAWFGTEFNRHNTWFEAGKPWVEYLRRCCFLLQQGARVADVAYFIGEDAPKMTGVREPALPPGRDFDYINAEVIEQKLTMANGRLTLPHGASYRVLVLPELATMRPEVLRKIRTLVRDGATVVGPRPSRSPSLEYFPKCDAEIVKLAAELWGGIEPGTMGTTPLDRRFGKGRVIHGKGLRDIFQADAVPADFTSSVKLHFTHRLSGRTHLYFVANPEPLPVTADVAFRVSGLAPELWHPDSGLIERAAVYDQSEGVTRLPLRLGPHGSVFVVFKEEPVGKRIVSVSRNGEPVLETKPPAAPETQKLADGAPANNFTLALWVRPAANTALVPETNQGVHGLAEPRNDALFPTHGSSFGDSGQAGCGLAVGRNGIVVFEHGANYFAPVLVHTAALTEWTYVAVVYRDGRPELYLNGAPVRRGLKSNFTVHPGRGGGGAPFRGELGPISRYPRTLSDAEIAQLSRATPRPETTLSGSPIELALGPAGAVTALAWQPGAYEFKVAGGQTRTLQVDPLPAPLNLAGPWEVRFTPGWGAPEKVTFDHLQDWTEHPDPGIRHYSGTAVYRSQFTWKPDAALEARNAKLFLDLGKVRDLATVRLNGQTLATLWLAPWRVEITKAIQAGKNVLEIEVVNPWNNRLVGDAQLPPEKRLTFLAAPTVSKDAPLLPAGLLGPVTIQSARILDVQLP